MTEDVWSESDTTPDAIDAALRELLHQRHAANHALAPARVLNLVVVVDRDWKGEVSNRLQQVGRYHASRTVLCTVEKGRTTLDARAVMSYDDAGSEAGLSVIHEEVEIDMGPAHLENLQTIIDPVIVDELPTMLWSPHGHDEAVAAVLALTDVILLDSADLLDTPEAFDRATTLLRDAYVVDLAWLRTTPWRERIAALFDPSDRRANLDRISRVVIRHREGSEASAFLLGGWLCSRLGWQSGGVPVDLEPVDQDAPGLAGVTILCGDASSLSLDRGPGGLRAQEQVDGQEHSWRILGASRGEGGILGEGVRQALLRDPTYGPALAAARRSCA
jgi:glucose-6-phosphate dehydrogenase assembly protein OpcA